MRQLSGVALPVKMRGAALDTRLARAEFGLDQEDAGILEYLALTTPSQMIVATLVFCT